MRRAVARSRIVAKATPSYCVASRERLGRDDKSDGGIASQPVLPVTRRLDAMAEVVFSSEIDRSDVPAHASGSDGSARGEVAGVRVGQTFTLQSVG